MTKAELVRQIAEETGQNADTVLTIIEGFMKATRNCLVNGDNLYLRGFGTFATKERAAKKARDISKGTTIEIPAHMVPTFKPSPEFKEMLK